MSTTHPTLDPDEHVARALPWPIWLGLPLAIGIAPSVTRAFSEDAYMRYFRRETGIVEITTALILAAAFVTGISLLRRAREYPAGWLKLWFGAFTLGCLYFLGEEISWGQHFFGWSTPEVLAESNDQSETNLHNLGGWMGVLLDQLPRTLLTIAAVVGGLIGPLVLRARRRGWDPQSDFRPWIWPLRIAIPAALGAVTISLPKKFFDEGVPAWLDFQAGESKEAFLAALLLVYALGVRASCLGRDARAGAAA